MGYTTYFNGGIFIDPPLENDLIEYINAFCSTRRMQRDVQKLEEFYKGKYGWENSYGIDGEYFIGGDSDYLDKSIININNPPSTQPGLWCQWVITDDGEYIEWDQGEKFYKSPEWMQYIIDNFIAPKGHICNGEIYATGEDSEDVWYLVVKDNKVTVEQVLFVREHELEKIKSFLIDISSDIEDILEDLKDLEIPTDIIKKLEEIQKRIDSK